MVEASPGSGDPRGRHLAMRALDRGLITSEQFDEALGRQQEEISGGRIDVRELAAILVDRGHLTPYQVELLRQEQAPAPAVDVAVAMPPPEAPGGTPFGKYRIRGELGRGGMAVVYEALEPELGRTVALKVLHGSANASPQEAALDEERFLREARLTALLPKHPHLVGVHEAGVVDGRRYIAMEFVKGRQLSQGRRDGSVLLKRQVELLRDVALAVHHAHEHGVIHRDLKPANILVDEDGRPHVTDFGLAKAAGKDVSLSLTAAGMVVGTPGYMSPEQAQGARTIDRRTDVYSLGVILYETLTGRPPFQGESAIAILTQVLRDPVPPPADLMKERFAAARDRAIEGVCIRALAKDPAERYPTAKALADDLSKWLAGEEIEGLPRDRLRGRRAILLAAIAAGLAFAWVVLPPDREVEKAATTPPPKPDPLPLKLNVESRAAWTDTGLDVAEGDPLELAAEGAWTCNDARDPYVGIAGGVVLFGTEYEHFTKEWPLPQAASMSLVARVGPAGAPWIVSASPVRRMPAAGRLFLGPNDSKFDDNAGIVVVTIRRPGPPAPDRDRLAIVKVPGRAEWSDSGLDVREGDLVAFVCEGTWTNHEGSQPYVSASGGKALMGTPYEHYCLKWPVPEGGGMALVARVGDAGKPWLAAEGRTHRVPATGRLFFGPNDFGCEDNGGDILVTVRRASR